ncbi:MAG: hypothetical protein [Circular genetic element sp.]|nr:MAG: hypothetical protein [Circular genetic element sp.]
MYSLRLLLLWVLALSFHRQKYRKDSVLVTFSKGPLCNVIQCSFPTSAALKKKGILFQSFCFVCKAIHFHASEKIHFRYSTSKCYGCHSRMCHDYIERRQCSNPSELAE